MKGKRNSEGVTGRAFEGEAPKDADALPVTLALESRGAERTPRGGGNQTGRPQAHGHGHRPTSRLIPASAGLLPFTLICPRVCSTGECRVPRGTASSSVSLRLCLLGASQLWVTVTAHGQSASWWTVTGSHTGHRGGGEGTPWPSSAGGGAVALTPWRRLGQRRARWVRGNSASSSGRLRLAGLGQQPPFTTASPLPPHPRGRVPRAPESATVPLPEHLVNAPCREVPRLGARGSVVPAGWPRS